MTFFCVKTRFSVANIRFLLDNAKLFHRFNSSENIKKARLLVPLKYLLDAFILFYSNFLHATIAILHDIQSLGWTYQSLTIYRIARYFLNIGRGCSLVDACSFEFYYILKVAKVREPIIIISSLRNIKDTFLSITTFECITTYSWYFLCIYIYSLIRYNQRMRHRQYR